MVRTMFQKNEFKKAKEWLQSNNYPLDLIKGLTTVTEQLFKTI